MSLRARPFSLTLGGVAADRRGLFGPAASVLAPAKAETPMARTTLKDQVMQSMVMQVVPRSKPHPTPVVMASVGRHFDNIHAHVVTRIHIPSRRVIDVLRSKPHPTSMVSYLTMVGQHVVFSISPFATAPVPIITTCTNAATAANMVGETLIARRANATPVPTHSHRPARTNPSDRTVTVNGVGFGNWPRHALVNQSMIPIVMPVGMRLQQMVWQNAPAASEMRPMRTCKRTADVDRGDATEVAATRRRVAPGRAIDEVTVAVLVIGL